MAKPRLLMQLHALMTTFGIAIKQRKATQRPLSLPLAHTDRTCHIPNCPSTKCVAIVVEVLGGICPTKMRFNTVWHGSCTLTSTARPTSTNRTAWTVHNKERYASVDLAVTHEWVAVVFCCTKIKFTGTICPPSQDSIKTIPDPAVI